MTITEKKQNLNTAQDMFRELAQANRLTPDLATAIGDGSIKYRDAVDYIKADVTGASGIQNLLLSKTDEAVGISSFEKNRLPAQNARLVHKMAVTFGEAESDLQAIATKSALSDPLLTSEIVVVADGQERFRMPLSAFHVAGSNVKPNERFLDLDTPFLLPDNKEIKVQLHTADGVIVTQNDTKTSALSVEFGSIGTFASL